MWINAWVCGHLHDGSTKWWRKQITPKTYEIRKTTRLFWMKHVAGNEVGRETCSLVKKSCRIWAHVCQNDRKYYQRMIPTSFVLGLYDCKKHKPGRILFGFLMIQVHPPVVWFVSSHSRHIHVPSLKFCSRLRGYQFSLLEVPSPESSVKCESLKRSPTFGEKILFKREIFGRFLGG